MKPDRCPTCKMRLRRSHPQNARYWSLLHMISEKLHPQGLSYSAETWHNWGKSKFLGSDEVTLPNGKTIQILKSTADLDVAEFSDYMTQMEAWANEHGVYLEDAVIA